MQRLMFTTKILFSMVVSMIKAKSQIKDSLLDGINNIIDVFPYVVSLQLKEIHGEEKYRVCTGTLIAPEWVITAAHCLRPEVKFVRYGNMAIPSNTTESIRKILKMFPHPHYKLVEPKSYVKFYDIKNDIGLILTQKITMSPVGKLSATDINTLTGIKVRYAGFGRSSDSSLDDLKPLKFGEGVTVKCPFNPRSHRVRPSMCVVPKKKQHKIGDSGAPIFYDATPLKTGRIIGGSITTINQYPDMVALLIERSHNNFRHECGGVILNNRAILTAAHCTQRRVASGYRARIGSTHAHSGGRVFNIRSINNHPNYDRNTLDSDLTILYVVGIIPQGSTMQPAKIAGTNYFPADNQPVWATGWGMTVVGNVWSGSEALRHVELRTVNQAVCRERYANRIVDGELRPARITDNMLCSGWLDIGGRDQCQGDSGGPLYHNGVVVGICSWGESCALPQYPGVNVRVSSFTSWIAERA